MRPLSGAGLVALFSLAAAAVPAQSLGEAAAKEKARRQSARGKTPPRSYTQEDLEKMQPPAPPGSDTASAAGSAPNPTPAPAPPSTPGGEAPAPMTTPEEGEAGPLAGAGREKETAPGDEWRDRHRQALAAVENARQNQGAAEAEVDRLKSTLNPMSTTFVTDPYAILQIQADLREAEARLADVKKAVEEAQKAADDVAAEARRNGVYLQ